MKGKGKKVLIGVIISVVIIVLIGIIIFLMTKLNNSNTNNLVGNNESSTSSKNIDNKNSTNNDISFANLKSDDDKFNEIESTIIDYFDDNYFYNFSITEFQQYPQIFKDSKVCTNAVIVKVLKSTDEEFEVVAVQGGALAGNVENGQTTIWDDGYGNKNIDEIEENSLLIIKGNQLEKRLTKGDVVRLYGRYNGVNDYSIDGKNYILPTINNINLIQLSNNDKESNYRFNLDKVKKVAEYIFGKDIKISTPVLGEDYKYEVDYSFNPFYKITLDNQSNVNFSVFNIYRDMGKIEYNKVSENTVKRLFITPDFQHYIVTTYDTKLKHVYVDYFDKEFNKLWSREFDNISNSDSLSGPLDYTNEKISIVVDNDLYVINTSNGENSINPVLVGDETRVYMMNDGIILIGNDNKDTIMKVGYDGNIIFRTNGNIDFKTIDSSSIQIIDNKMVIYLVGTGKYPDLSGFEYEEQHYKYLVVNSDGTIEKSTEGTSTLN